MKKPAFHLFYETMGEKSNPPLLLLHGMLSSNFQWENNKHFLAQHFYLIMAELWCHGRSPSPDDPSYFSATGYTEQIEYIRQKEGIANWSIVGQSFGAGVAMCYVLEHPEYCRKFVLTNSRLALGTLLNDPDKMVLPERLQDWPIHPIHAKRLDPDLKEKLIEVADMVDYEGLKIGLPMNHTLACRDRVDQLQTSTLICNGIYEKSFQEHAAYAISENPRISVVNFETGHNPNRDMADLFNEVVYGFLRK